MSTLQDHRSGSRNADARRPPRVPGSSLYPSQEALVLKTTLLHPGILGALATSGHGSQVLITDGNFPHQTAPYPGAVRVYLNLSPGRLTVSEVLEALIQAIPI